MKKLLIIAPNWPAPDYSAAGVRLMQLVVFFQEDFFRRKIIKSQLQALPGNL